MLYAIHDRDSGEIYQANKLYVGNDELKKYEGDTTDLGHKFVKRNASGLLPPEHWYVDVKAEDLVSRPIMQATAYANTIKAGTNAVLLNLPIGADITIMAVGYQTPVHVFPKVDGDELEFPLADVPCIYQAIIRKFPHKDCTITIEAVA